ncbi:hypothetical protein DVK07_05095 [Halorubrum sp. Atlit-26R]|nr:hypothetical protein DVK07_05095 [Halorubrum sp. Atlit-26R]
MVYRYLLTESQQGGTKLGATELIGLRFVDRDTNNHSLRYCGSRVVVGIDKADCSPRSWEDQTLFIRLR